MNDPAYLPEIVGHERPRGFLRGIEERDRIPTGMLFFGGKGRGKRTVARAFVRRQFCRSRIGCGACRTCIRLDAGSFGDFDVVDVEDEKTRIGIDRIRRLREWFTLAPYESDRRAVLIDEAHLMTEEAQNALLKLLEEPTGRGFFILVSSEPGLLLETVRSRVQELSFGPLSEDQLRQVFIRQGRALGEDLALVLSLARGSAGRALELAEGGKAKALLAAAESFLDRRVGPFGFAEKTLGGRGKARDQRAETIEFLETLGEILMRALAARFGSGTPARGIEVLASRELDLEAFEGLLSLCAESMRAVHGQISPRLVLESSKIRAHRLLARTGA